MRAGNWNLATGQHVICRYNCGGTLDQIERDGHQFFCSNCGKAWKAFTRDDHEFLKVQKIKPTP